jgi:hypothetical protein
MQPYARGLAAAPAARWGFALADLEGVSVPYAALPQRRAVPYSRRVENTTARRGPVDRE